jgi:acylphosphatase
VTGPDDDWDGIGQFAGPSSGAIAPGAEARLTAWVRGRVQGVGFRWWVRRNALELGLLGSAENLVDGRVKVVAEGGRDSLAELLDRLEGPGTPGQVAQVTHRWDPVRGGFSGFVER